MVNSTTRAFRSPMKYIQGPGEFNKIEKYANDYGERPLFLIDGFLFNNISEKLKGIYRQKESKYYAVSFEGECCQEEIDRVSRLTDDFAADVLVGVGGGKTLDTVKIISARHQIPLIVSPTSASTDAPTSAMSVLYTKDGTYLKNIRHKKNAELVLMDTDIVSRAPLRLFIAGMGDALATYFEAVLENYKDAKVVSNWLMGEFMRLLNEHEVEITEVKVKPKDLAKLFELQDKGTISSKIAKTVFEEMFISGKAPETVVKEKGLVQISDVSEIEKIVADVIKNNPDPVAQYLEGKEKVLGFLVGQVMKFSKGKANPQMANDYLKKALDELK